MNTDILKSLKDYLPPTKQVEVDSFIIDILKKEIADLKKEIEELKKKTIISQALGQYGSVITPHMTTHLHGCGCNVCKFGNTTAVNNFNMPIEQGVS